MPNYRRRRVLAVACVVLLVIASYLTLDAYDRVPGILTTATPVPAPVSPSASPATPRAGMPTATPAASAPVLPVVAADGPDAGAPTRAKVTQALADEMADPALGDPSVLVIDALTGQPLVAQATSTPRIPASATKLASAVAILSTLGADRRLHTTVVGSGPRIWLVAGGDTLLAKGKGSASKIVGRAGLGDLARVTAASLADQGRDSVRLSVDTSYAPGPRLAPTWSAAFFPSGVTDAVAMIGLASQRGEPGRAGPSDPASSVTAEFARQLRARGITVRVVGAGRAPTDATPLAKVSSATVAEQSGVALNESDNALTEVLARQATAVGAPGTVAGGVTFAESGAFIAESLKRYAVPFEGVSLVDASGLSRENRLTAVALGAVLRLASGGADQEIPGFAQAVLDLPIAGLTGTLAERFTEPSARPAIGIVRAKTGTLNGVASLSGLTATRAGRPLFFVVLADQVPASAGTYGGRDALDRFVAALTRCGCS